ncbi:MAG: FecR domain-containing protein [Cyclobacteriaceae bacterium]
MDKQEFQDLLDRHLEGKSSQDEEKYLYEFFDTHKGNGEDWDEKQLGDRIQFQQKLLEGIKGRVQASEVVPASSSSRFYQVLGYAAVVALLIGVSFLFYINRSTTEENAPVSWVQKGTQKGEKVTFKLADGTIVKMNAESRLEFPEAFVNGKREVVLTGEAFFEVARDENKPFIISSGNITTTVLGTSFNINAYPESGLIEVAVATGKVKVEHTGKKANQPSDVVYLNPNRKATYRVNRDEIVVSSYNIDEELAWKEGILYFHKANEASVVARLERWFGVQVRVENKSPNEWDLTASFDNQSLEEILKSLSYTAKFEYSIKNNQVTIRY